MASTIQIPPPAPAPQMEHDQTCQDVYKLRSKLQRLQAAKASDSAATQAGQLQSKKQVDWLMREHRQVSAARRARLVGQPAGRPACLLRHNAGGAGAVRSLVE
jgi:hypothetical protein